MTTMLPFLLLWGIGIIIGTSNLVRVGANSNNNYTDREIQDMYLFDWCTTDDQPVQWINKDEDAVNAKISAGARSALMFNEEGRIDDLDGFVNDRLSTLPSEVLSDNLPTIIIENDCASVTTSSEDCIFDYTATPAPFEWPNTGFKLENGRELPSNNILNWERNDMTIVYVPASDTSNGAEELTNQSSLARLKTRGNSSKANPKKQYSLKLPNKKEFIPGGAEAKRWILSAYQLDRTYIKNKLAYDMYRKFGELQKTFSTTWPTEGSNEDLLARAFSPRSQMVNLIFQGRYAGIFYLMDKIEVREGRVYLPEDTKNSNVQERKEVDGIQLPKGNYFLRRDWSSANKMGQDPFSYTPAALEEDLKAELPVTNYRNSSDNVFMAMLNVTNPMAWSIESPEDKSFADSDTEEDVALLKGFLLKLHEWLEDPVGNEDILSAVIDMPSMARWFLLAEFTQECDGYVASNFFKVSDGKLYHASPWDYAGSCTFNTDTCEHRDELINAMSLTMYSVDRETNTYTTIPACDESTGNMNTAGWWVNTMHIIWEIGICNSGSYNCDKGGPTVTDMRYDFANMFRIPALQKEFWNLWDIVLEHGLVENNGSDSGDLFSTDLFAGQIFEPIRLTVTADKRIWYSTLENTDLTPFALNIPSDICEPLLEVSLEESVIGNSSSSADPYIIPGQEWTFHTAYENGNFINFYEGLLSEAGPNDFISNYLDSDYLLAKERNYFKYRLDWINSQRPGKTNNDNSNTNEPPNTTFYPAKSNSDTTTNVLAPSNDVNVEGADNTEVVSSSSPLAIPAVTSLRFIFGVGCMGFMLL